MHSSSSWTRWPPLQSIKPSGPLGLLQRERLRFFSAKASLQRSQRVQRSSPLAAGTVRGGQRLCRQRTAGETQRVRNQGNEITTKRQDVPPPPPVRLAKCSHLLVVGVETGGRFSSIVKTKSHLPYHPAIAPLRFTQAERNARSCVETRMRMCTEALSIEHRAPETNA